MVPSGHQPPAIKHGLLEKIPSFPIQSSFFQGICQPAPWIWYQIFRVIAFMVEICNQWRNATRLCTSERRDHQYCGAHCGPTLGYLPWASWGCQQMPEVHFEWFLMSLLDFPKLGLWYEHFSDFSGRVYSYLWTWGKQAIVDHPGLLIQWTMDQISKVFSRTRMCSPDVAQPSATVRRRPCEARRVAVPMASCLRVVTFGGFRRRVTSFRMAGVALCDIPTCWLRWGGLPGLEQGRLWLHVMSIRSRLLFL